MYDITSNQILTYLHLRLVVTCALCPGSVGFISNPVSLRFAGHEIFNLNSKHCLKLALLLPQALRNNKSKAAGCPEQKCCGKSFFCTHEIQQ